MKTWPGKPYPLGAHWDQNGVNFSIFSENATGVELLIYRSSEAKEPSEQIHLEEPTAHIWHTYVPGIRPGELYAYRIHGPYQPEKGHRFNSSKLLIDPYTKAIAGEEQWDDALFGYRIGDPSEDLSKDERDSSQFNPKSVVTDPEFDWEEDRPKRTPWNQTIIYEVHVKGFTIKHPDLEDWQRGTYKGFASPKVIDYLKDLGITAVELLPVHQHVDERMLVDRGLKNYWGYNTIGFFAPDSRYSSSGVSGEQVREFKEMVKSLHQGGIEVILDVVYNHTSEGNHLGPTLSFRGIDNASYYRLVEDNSRYYMDFTGTGNTLNMRNPHVLQLIMDSLRYWVIEMHVDGFRFDLAASLAREFYEVDRLSSFFDIIQQDPVVSQVKLIAEPWDLGEGGYQVGNFPHLWAEWNGRYRDSVRRFWRGDQSQVTELGYRLTGSSDLYQSDGRRPYSSINFVTAHDGFTLNDLVSYNQKHNEANKNDNRDGADENSSWNCGAEGPTDDHEIIQLRECQKRNLLATLFLSQGVPMILGGDEISRTQNGNNNAYCQDNEMTWFDWGLDERKKALLEFTRTLIRFRMEHPVLRRRRFFQGRKLVGSEVKDITWLQPDGSEMTRQVWEQSYLRSLGVLLAGNAIDEVDEKGESITGDTLYILLNAHHETISFVLPKVCQHCRLALSTHTQGSIEEERSMKGGETFALAGRSIAVLKESVS